MDGILKIFNPSFILNGFNTPGTKTSRSFDALGVKPDELANAVVAQIQAPSSVEDASSQGKVILMGAAALGLVLLFTGNRRR